MDHDIFNTYNIGINNYNIIDGIVWVSPSVYEVVLFKENVEWYHWWNQARKFSFCIKIIDLYSVFRLLVGNL